MANLEPEIVYYDSANCVSVSEDYVEEAYNAIYNLAKMDKRLIEYYQKELEKIQTSAKELNANMEDINNVARWVNDVTDSYVETQAKTEEIAQGAGKPQGGSSTPTTPTTPSSTPKTEPVKTYEVQHIFIDENFAESLPEDVKTQIVDELKQAGYKDDEIEDILLGRYAVHKLTAEGLAAAIVGAVAVNPEVAKMLQKTVGFEILDESGNVDLNKLQVADLIAEKNLGMEINMSEGAPFKLHVEKIASELENTYQNNPEVRNVVKEKYGIDVFNEDGKVDQNKLALIRVVDGQDNEDEYDITKTLEECKKKKTTEEQPTAPPSEPTAPPSEPTAPPSEPTAPPSEPTAPPSEPTAPPSEPSAPPTTPTTPPSSVTPVPETVAPAEDNDGPFTPSYESPIDDLSASITDALEELDSTKEITDDLIESNDRTTGKVIPKIEPISNGGNGEVGGKKSSVGVLTAAGIAAGGAVTGGGILLHKKTSVINFGPADWAALGADYHGIIEKLMENVGFREEEIERFKTTKYKIPTAEIKEHITKIEKALDQNPMLEDEILKVYDYTFLDDENKVIEYLLFITMAIDGRNNMDGYNMYNIINESLNNPNDANFIYTGINLEDYVDKSSYDEQLTAEEMEMIDEETDNLEGEASNEELEEVNPAVDKEWLKGIGIEKE